MSNICRAVSAVVRHHIDGNPLGGVALLLQAVDQISDHSFFISGCNQNGESMGLTVRQRILLFQQCNRNIRKLIGIAGKKQRHDDVIDDFDCFHIISPQTSVLSSALF